MNGSPSIQLASATAVVSTGLLAGGLVYGWAAVTALLLTVVALGHVARSAPPTEPAVEGAAR